MAQSVNKGDRNLLEILVSIAWIDGEIQPEEKKLLEKITVENDMGSAGELPKLFARYQNSSTEQCYRLIEEYVGSNPDLADYNNLLNAVSKLIYSDDDITTEEAELLTKIQDLDPQSQTHSTLDRVIDKIQQLYQKALKQQL